MVRGRRITVVAFHWLTRHPLSGELLPGDAPGALWESVRERFWQYPTGAYQGKPSRGAATEEASSWAAVKPSTSVLVSSSSLK